MVLRYSLPESRVCKLHSHYLCIYSSFNFLSLPQLIVNMGDLFSFTYWLNAVFEKKAK